MHSQDSPSLPVDENDRTRVMIGASRSVLTPGFLLGHTYIIEGFLARGGMAEVYRARHIELKTEHVIKVILPSLANDPKIAELFREEGRKLKRLRSDAIVDYEGFFRDERGLLYLVMEFVDGESLATVLARRRLETGDVLKLRDRLAEGLAAAHDMGIVHRDISPENIILPNGRVEQAKLIDFGIAKSLDAGDATLIGSDFAGKYAFVAPEQAGLFGGRVDSRADIYSLGLVLAAAAIGYGKKLDMGSSPSTVIGARQRVPDLSAVPAALRPVIAPMLEPRPDDRPASMRELLKGTKPRRRLGLPLIGAGVLLVVLLAGVLVVFIPRPPAPSLEELRAKVAAVLSGYRCASLDSVVAADGSVRLSGYAATPDDIKRLPNEIANIHGIGPVDSKVGLRIWPYCEVMALLKPIMQAQGSDAPVLALASGSAEAHIGERLALDVQAPAFDSYIYIDYFDDEGEVLHLFPNRRDSLNFKPKRNRIAFQPGSCWILSGNPGEQLLSMVAAARPLFSGDRPEVEKTGYYLASLSDAIRKSPKTGIAGSVLFFDLRASERSDGQTDACPAQSPPSPVKRQD
jgi:serine/threonine protein kinase